MKPRYQGDVLSTGRARFAFCFLLNEVGDLSFFWHKIILLLLFEMSNLSKLYISQTSLVTYFIKFHISSHHNVGNDQEKLKEKLTTSSINRESP